MRADLGRSRHGRSRSRQAAGEGRPRGRAGSLCRSGPRVPALILLLRRAAAAARRRRRASCRRPSWCCRGTCPWRSATTRRAPTRPRPRWPTASASRSRCTPSRCAPRRRRRRRRPARALDSPSGRPRRATRGCDDGELCGRRGLGRAPSARVPACCASARKVHFHEEAETRRERRGDRAAGHARHGGAGERGVYAAARPVTGPPTGGAGGGFQVLGEAIGTLGSVTSSMLRREPPPPPPPPPPQRFSHFAHKRRVAPRPPSPFPHTAFQISGCVMDRAAAFRVCPPAC